MAASHHSSEGIARGARMQLRGDYSLIAHAVSDYAVGPAKRLFSIYVFAGAAAALLLATAVLADTRFPMRAGLYLASMALLRLGVLAFSTDLEGHRTTRIGLLHYGFAVASFALIFMAIDVLFPIALPNSS